MKFIEKDLAYSKQESAPYLLPHSLLENHNGMKVFELFTLGAVVILWSRQFIIDTSFHQTRTGDISV